MKKILAFLQNSNHYKHLIGGFIVSWLTASPYAGIYAAVVAATCPCLLLPITTHKKYKEGRRGDNGTSQPGTIPKLLHFGCKLHFSCHAP